MDTSIQVFLLLMLQGIMVFGNLVAELGEINRVVREEETDKMQKVQTAADFMHGFNVAKPLAAQVLNWTRFQHTHTHTHAHTAHKRTKGQRDKRTK